MQKGEIQITSRNWDSHYYKVTRFGRRSTTKYFSNLKDATAYYDKLCMKGGADIWLSEHRRPGSEYAENWVYTTDMNVNITHRDVSKKKKRSGTDGFGFPVE